MENTGFKVYIEEKSQDYGKLYIEPLERGYGDTLGNALRRLLLSSIEGAAVTAVRIEGILHEFSTIKGIREDVIEILMNLKHIPIKAKTEAPEGEHSFKIITLDSDELPKDFFTRKENPGVITAKDLPWDSEFEFCGNGVLCTLEPNAKLLMEIYVERGVGYLSAERERPSQPSLPIDALLTDAIFSPVKRVNYQIEPARVGQSIDYERLILEVWTNGALTPDEAVGEAARIAQNYFTKIANTVASAPQVARVVEEAPEPVEKTKTKTKTPKGKEKPEQFDHPIHELELSIRSENCLLRGGIQTVGDLLQKSRDDLLKIRNLGKISLTEIEERLEVLGYVLKPSAPGSEELGDDAVTIEEDSVAEPEKAEEFEEVETVDELPEKVEEVEEPKEPEPKKKTRTAKPKTTKTTKAAKAKEAKEKKTAKSTKAAKETKKPEVSEEPEEVVEEVKEEVKETKATKKTTRKTAAKKDTKAVKEEAAAKEEPKAKTKAKAKSTSKSKSKSKAVENSEELVENFSSKKSPEELLAEITKEADEA